MGERIKLEYTSAKLDNGLTILVQANQRVPVVSYQTWLRAGSADDPAGRTGMAHLFEHLMFKGTEAVPEGDFDRLIEAAGGRTNAATWLDWTQFYVDAPSAALNDIVTLEADRFSNLTVDETLLETEREVVLNERRERVDDDPDGRMSERLWHMVFGKHPYGQPTIGWDEDIRAITQVDCRRFYDQWYTPDHAIIVVAGDIEPSAVIDGIASAYGNLKPSNTQDAPVADMPRLAQAGVQNISIATGGERLLVGFRGPAGTDVDNIALEVLNEILFVGESSRVTRALVTESEVAAGAYGFVAALRHTGLYEVGVDCRPGRSGMDALELLDEILTAVRRNGITHAELEKARNRLETRAYKTLQTAQSRAQALGYWSVVADDPLYFLERAELVARIGMEDIERVTHRWLQHDERMIVHAHPIDGSAQ